MAFNFLCKMDKLFGGGGEETTTNNKSRQNSRFQVLGDSKVGKSSLLSAYCNIEYERPKAPKVKETVGINTHIKKITSVNGISELITEFIDFSGDSEYINELPIFLR